MEALWAVTSECWRVLKPTGSMWVNLGDKYAGSDGTSGGLNSAASAGRKRLGIVHRSGAPKSDLRAKSLMGLPWRYAIGCIDGEAAPDGQRWILRAEVIWSKPNGLPESVTDRVRRSHETWFHLVKSPRYFAAVDEVREAHSEATIKRKEYDFYDHRGGKATRESWGDGGMPDKRIQLEANPLGKLPGSVWQIPSEPLLIPEAVQRHYDLPDHFAAFPQELPRRIILGWSPVGGIVLDPFMGTGTTAMVARTLGRFGVSVDLSADYNRLARWRIFESGHGEKAAQRTWRENQGDLFGNAPAYEDVEVGEAL